MGFGLEQSIPSGTIRERSNGLARYLLHNADDKTEDGHNLADAIVQDLVARTVGPMVRVDYPELNRSLERDGFTVENGVLRRSLPEALNLPETLDEVHVLLQHYGFKTSEGHLDQAIGAHGRGEWASANAQLRAFTESLIDEAAQALDQGMGHVPPAGEARWQWLANLNPPFFLTQLNEWRPDG